MRDTRKRQVPKERRYAMHIEGILKQIEHTAEEVEFIAKDNSDGMVCLDVACTDGTTFGLKFNNETDRETIWHELSEAPPVPFVGIGNTFVRVKHLRSVKVDIIEKEQAAIVLGFTSPTIFIRPYDDPAILERDYWALIQILSKYQDQSANAPFSRGAQ